MGRGAWWTAVHGVATSQTQLSDFTFTFHFHAWRRKWQPTPVFLPGESQGWQSQVGCIYGVTQSRTRLKRLNSSSSNQMCSLLLGCCWSNIFKWTGLGNIYIYMHTHIYITLSHIHIFISAYIYTDINKYGFQLWIQLQNSISGFIPALSFLLRLLLFTGTENLDFHYPCSVNIFDQSPASK